MIRNNDRLAVRGPIDPDNGFPRWYKDANGVRLELAADPADPNTPAIGELPDPAAPVSFPDNFPDEAFYFLAEAELPIGGGPRPGRARVILALEAAFALEVPQDGQQQVFARIRVRIDNGVPGAAYVVTHPYGETDPLVADENGRVFVTEDIGAAALAFDTVVRDGEVAPFLRWDTGAPDGYLGIGGVDHTVTGSPFGTDFVRITGPGADQVQTDLFSVQGRLARVAGAEVDRAVYARTDGLVTADVFATSEEGQTLRAAGATLRADQTRYHVRAELGTAVPDSITLVNATDQPPTTVTAPLVDAVTIQTATYDTATRRLTVEATSSDLDGPKELTVTGFGGLTDGSGTFEEVDAPPAAVEVTSAHGGSHTRHVLVDGPAGPADPLTADAGPDRAVVTGDLVTLDASASTGPATGFAWAQTAGTPVTLSDPAAARTTFTAPAPGPLRFTVTVNGTETDSVAIVVTAPSPTADTLTVGRAEFRTDAGRWRVDGTATGPLPDRVTVTLNGVEIGTSPVDATLGWDVRRTVIPGESGVTPAGGDTVTITSTRGGTVSTTVTVRR
jgi:K319-like protein